MAALAKRAILIGIDGASMEIVRYMADKGATPNLKRLMDTGAWRPMLGVFPRSLRPAGPLFQQARGRAPTKLWTSIFVFQEGP